MENLNKIFVSVITENCSTFRTKYVTGTPNTAPEGQPSNAVARKNDYDGKICFLEDKQEIFTKGKLYGLNNSSDVNALSTLVGTLPKRPAIGAEGESGYEAERDYTNIIEYINEMASGQASVSSKLSSSITVAGGPLADDIADVDWPWGTEGGNKVIPAGTSFEEIFTKLFLKSIDGTVTLGAISWSPSLAQPTATIGVTGEQEVGTETTVTIGAVQTVSGNSRTVTVTATQGYFLNDGTSWNSGNYKPSKSGTTTGSAAIETSTWNGETVATGNTVTISEGTNTLYVKQSGITASVSALDSDTVYASTNTKSKLSEVSVSISDTTPDDKELSRDKSATITGIRYMFSGSNTTQNETFNSAVIRALNGTKAEAKASTTTSGYSISVVEGAKQVVIAVPATYSVTNVYDTGAFGTDIFSEFNMTNVDVEGANGYTSISYKVYAYKPASALGANTYYVKVTKP